jgi:two-component system, OmpR family, response regulator
MNRLKILVVDDDPVTLLILEKNLKKVGYEVETALDGNEGFDLISKYAYDVVLTDLIMPGLDGIGLLEAVKARHSRTEVVLLTAHASVDTAVAAMKKGAADYLQKPVNTDELLLRLGKISNMKALVKNVGDLRDAMDVTEKSASETIQDLEMRVSLLQDRIAGIRNMLLDEDIDPDRRFERIREILSADP